MQRLKLQITHKDIKDARRYGIANPLLYVLVKRTSTLWRIHDNGEGTEIQPPYRSFTMSGATWAWWYAYQLTRVTTPCVLEIQIQEGGSTSRRREPFEAEPAGWSEVEQGHGTAWI